jgi:hypothetical protein
VAETEIQPPKLFDPQTGASLELPEADIPRAVALGRAAFLKGTEIPVVSPDGKVGTIPSENAFEAFRSGYHYEPLSSQVERANKAEYGEGFTNTAKAALAGAARGATLGLSDLALTKSGLVEPGTLANLEKYNPGVSTTSNLAGAVLPILATGGIAAAPEAAVEGAAKLGATDLLPSVAASRIGAAVTRGAEGLVGSAGAKTLAQKIVTTALPAAAGSAVEGALFGAGNAVSEAALGDTDLTGEKLLSHVGIGAVLGAGLGGVLGTAEAAIPVAVQKAQETMGSSVSKLAQFLPDSLVKGVAQASGVISGKDPEVIEKLLSQPFTAEGAAMRRSAVESLSDQESVIRDTTSAIDEQLGGMKQALKTTFGSNRPEEISQTLMAAPFEPAFDSAVNLSAGLKSAIKEMRSEPELYAATGRVRRLEVIQEGLEKNLTNATSAEDVFHAVNQAKQEISPLASYGKIASDAERTTASKIKEVNFGFKKELENTDLYGHAAVRQAAFNDAYREYQLAEKAFVKKFANKVETKSGAIAYEASPRKVSSFLKQVGKPTGDESQEILSNYMASSQRLINEMGETAKSSTKGLDTQKLLQLAQKTQGETGSAVDQLTLANQFKTLKKFEQSGIGTAAMISGGAHMAGLPASPLLAAYAGYHALKNPASLIKGLSYLEGAAQKATRVIEGGARAFFRAGDRLKLNLAAVPASVNYLGQTRLDRLASDRSKKDRYEAFNKRFKEVSNAVSDPQGLSDRIATNVAGVSQVAPKTASSVIQKTIAGAQFLYDKAPKNPNAAFSLHPAKEVWHPSDAEISKWERYVTAVDQPLSIMRDLAKGTITHEAVEAVQSVYPKLYSEMQSKVLEKLTETKKQLPYGKRLALSTFLGSPVDVTTTPAFLQQMQANLSAPPPQAPQGMGGGPKSFKTLSNIAAQTQTDTQKILTRSE